MIVKYLCHSSLSLRKAVDEAVDTLLKGISVYVAQDCTGMENLEYFTEGQIWLTEDFQ